MKSEDRIMRYGKFKARMSRWADDFQDVFYVKLHKGYRNRLFVIGLLRKWFGLKFFWYIETRR